MVNELVAGDRDEPGDGEVGHLVLLNRADRGQERLAGEILGGRGVAHPRREVSVDLGQRPVVQREQPRTLVGGCAFVHTLIIARREPNSDG